ncbi:MAG: NUDIX domain-containing protein [Patescibacteria group bacterium]
MRLATLAVIVKNGRVLLGYKKKGVEEISDILNGPGGKVEPEESLEECVVRETAEELGVYLNPYTLDEVAVIIFYAAGVPDFEVHVFRSSDYNGTPRETEKMIPECNDVGRLPIERMLEGDRAWFEKAVRGERFNADVYYREKAKGFERIEYFPFKD